MAMFFIGLLGQPKKIIIRLISLLLFNISVVDSLLVQLIPCYQLSKAIFVDPIFLLLHLLSEGMLFAHIEALVF